MAIFRPPTDNFVVPVIVADYMGGLRLSKDQRLANRLGGRIEASPRGRNIFLLTNGTFTTNQPSEMDTVRRTFLGGHDNYVDDIEAAALIAAGYSVLPGTFELDSVYSSSLDSSATLGS